MLNPPPISLWLISLVLGTVCCSSALEAQHRTVVLAGRSAQYVFVVDDSGSMGGSEGQAADPDRLAVFAVRSIVQMLDDEDQVTVIRLNGSREGESASPLRELGKIRSSLETRLGTDSRLAAYEGSHTPCRSALEDARTVLNQAFTPGVPQVVMFLTDGRCTPVKEQLTDPQAYLSSLRSYDEDLFRFYLLRFRGREFSRDLEALARHAGGQALEVDAAEATALVEPFADALTRAQGYEAEVVDAADSTLESYAGARRVRLLAVARGEGSRLGFRLASPGREPRLRGLRTGRHRYGNGDVYRFAAAEYRPEGEPVEVEVLGAGNEWKVVAVPEYRLSAQLEIRRGTCSEDGPQVRHGLETGSSVCAVVSLTNEQGRPVPRSGIEARIRLESRGVEPRELPAEPLSTPGQFGLQRQRLEPGDYVFQGVVLLELSRDERVAELRSRPRSIQVSSMRIDPRPATLEVGEVLPGQETPARSMVFQGNFPATPARMEVSQRRQLPSCLTFTLGGAAEGDELTVAVGQEYPLILRAAPYCGPQSFEKTFHNHLRLVFDDSALPAVEIPVSVTLDYRIEVPEEPLTLGLTAGDMVRLPLRLGGNQTRPLEMEVLLEESKLRREGPGEDDLRLGWGRPDQEGWLDVAPEEPLRVTLAARETTAVLQARADTCCPGGTYVTQVGLMPISEEPYGGDPEPLILPVQIEVEAAETWACWWPRVCAALVVLLVLLLLGYLFFMWRNSDFLRRERLADGLVPLVWNGFGTPEPAREYKKDVLRMVRRSMPWWKRGLNWLKANPLVFGLPRGSYRETVELVLQPHRDVSTSRVRLVPERDLLGSVKERPVSQAGRMFAHAKRGGVSYFGVPERDRLGNFVSDAFHGGSGNVWAEYGAPDGNDETQYQIHRFQGSEEWIRPIERHERDEGGAAGWRIG